MFQLPVLLKMIVLGLLSSFDVKNLAVRII